MGGEDGTAEDARCGRCLSTASNGGEPLDKMGIGCTTVSFMVDLKQ